MKKIAVIDPFLLNPALPCFNRLADHLPARLQYHHPQQTLETLQSHAADAYIVLGSASFVTEELPWHRPLADFLFQALHQNKPVLGICFGHQLMCQRFGAPVNYHISPDVTMTGVREVKVLKDIYGLKSGTTLGLAVTHKQVVKDLPVELEEIGVGLRNDIVRHKTLPFLGTQVHPEASNHFCATEAFIETQVEIQRVQADGLKLISAFFQHHGIIGNILQ